LTGFHKGTSQTVEKKLYARTCLDTYVSTKHERNFCIWKKLLIS